MEILIPGITFVLSMDKEQLSHSISALYGLNFDATGYLKRFIDLEYNLRTPQPALYIDYLFEILKIEDYFERRSLKSSGFARDRQGAVAAISLIANGCNFSLRDIEQFLGRLKLVIYATPDENDFYPQLAVFLIYIKLKRPEVFRQQSPGQLRKQLLVELKDIATKAGGEHSRVAATIEAHIVMLLVGEEFQGDKELLGSLKKREVGFDESLAGRNHARAILTDIEHMISLGQQGVPYEPLALRVSMMSDFNFDA